MKCASAMLTNGQVKILKTATKTAIKSNEVGIEFRLPSARSCAVYAACSAKPSAGMAMRMAA
jgi:hypothetical protein